MQTLECKYIWKTGLGQFPIGLVDTAKNSDQIRLSKAIL